MSIPKRWLWQTLGWGLWCGISLLWWAQLAPLTSSGVLVMLLVAGGLFASSEAMRWTLLRRGWLEQSGWSLLWKIGLSAVLCSVLVQVLSSSLVRVLLAWGWVTPSSGGPEYRWGTALGYMLNTSILLWLWFAGWVSWQYLQRYRQGEIDKWQAQAAQNKLELDVLKGQINPHFMFNALNNLRAMINEDRDKARDMVTRLSNILRHTLYHSQRERVSVAEELAVVRDYIALEQVHYEDCLQVRWDVAADVDAATLPPMLLQLLVENAVKHGIAKTVGGGMLTVAVQRTIEAGAPVLSLRVSNPGHWAPQAQTLGGVGLHNVRERLLRVCGPGAQCQVSSDSHSVCVSLLIPQ